MINTRLPLMVSAIFITGMDSPLTNKIVFIADPFLIVANDMDDTSPVWYSLHTVQRLEGVERTGEGIT